MVSIPFFKKKKEGEEGYIEVVPVGKTKESKVLIRIFVLKDSSDVKAIVDTLREGNTIVFIDIREFKKMKDIVELKRVINRIKSVVDAINGDIVGVGGDWIIATPSFARIWRAKESVEVIEEKPTEEGKK